jgi:hypothetical protein
VLRRRLVSILSLRSLLNQRLSQKDNFEKNFAFGVLRDRNDILNYS